MLDLKEKDCQENGEKFDGKINMWDLKWAHINIPYICTAPYLVYVLYIQSELLLYVYTNLQSNIVFLTANKWHKKAYI